MNPIEALLSDPFAHALGWTLLHFVWQGGLVALLLAIALRVLRRHTAPVRYAVACSALVLLLALPMITLGLLWPVSAISPGDGMTVAASIDLSAQAEAVTLEAGAASSEVAAAWWQTAYAMLGAALPWLVLIWITGVLTLSVRYLAGWTYTVHLRRRGTREVGQRWQEQLVRLKQQLGVTRPVRLVASALVHVPTVAGWLRPVILMPVGVFTGLTPRQVEMVLAHELAHIRRHDYLVNLMQAMCETLLFYHPAVWWVSQCIRIEREHCCDDLVVAVCGDAYTYAEALAKMEQDRQAAPRLVLAATGGSLRDRVRRLLEGPAEASPGATRWLAGLTLVAVLLMSLTLSPVLDDAWDQAYAWITGDGTEETLHSGTEGRLFINTGDERGVVIDSFRDGETHTVVLKGPDVEVTMPPGSRLVVDDLNGPSPEGRIDFRENTVTFSGDLALEIWQGDKKVSHVVARDATVVYALPNEGRAVARNGDRPRQHPLLGRGYGDTAQRLERLIFNDPSQSVQLEALDELRVLPKRTSLTPLINIAERHPRHQVRNEAVQWLGRIGDAYVVYPLERIALDDHSFPVQMEALDALRNLPAKIGLPSLMKIAQVHPRAAMRSEAVQWLRRIDGEAARLLLERILFEDPDASVQLEAFDALKKLINNPWTFNQIAETHSTEAVREKAYQWLRRWRFTQDRLQGKQRRQRGLASPLQPSVRGYQNTAEKLERLVFEDQDPSVQREALDALMNLPGRAIKPSLERIIETHPDATLRAKAAVRLQAVHSEEAFNKEMVAALETSHNNPRASERIAAVQRLKEWTSPQLFRPLTNIAFDDPSLEVQLEALDALRKRGGLQSMAGIARIARTHPTPMMRLKAVQSIDDMQADDRLPLLEEIIFDDENAKVQEEAFKRLHNAPEAEVAAPSLQRIAEEHPSRLFRNLARRRLDAARETDEEEPYSWSQALDDLRHPSASRRLKALDKIEEKKSIDLITTLADMAYEDPSLEVQLEILDIFRDRGDWDGDSWVVHIAQNHPNVRMRSEAVQSLQNQDAETIQPALQHIVFHDASLEVRQEALDLINDLPDELSVPVLIEVARNHPDEKMRREAFEELEDRDDPRAREAVQRNQ